MNRKFAISLVCVCMVALVLLVGCAKKEPELSLPGTQYEGSGATIILEGANILAGNIGMNQIMGHWVTGEPDAKGVRPFTISNIEFLASAPSTEEEETVRKLQEDVVSYVESKDGNYLADSEGNALLTQMALTPEAGIADEVNP